MTYLLFSSLNDLLNAIWNFDMLSNNRTKPPMLADHFIKTPGQLFIRSTYKCTPPPCRNDRRYCTADQWLQGMGMSPSIIERDLYIDLHKATTESTKDTQVQTVVNEVFPLLPLLPLSAPQNQNQANIGALSHLWISIHIYVLPPVFQGHNFSILGVSYIQGQ